MIKHRQPRVFLCLLSAVCCLLTGCVYRSLTIKTNPPGAQVYVNDQLKGQSPLAYDFEWYGWHRVKLQKDGYQRLDDRKLLRAPIYMWIPFDLIMELLPFPIRDWRVWTYDLVPAPELPTPVPPELLNKPKLPKAPAAPKKPEASEPVTTVESEPVQPPAQPEIPAASKQPTASEQPAAPATPDAPAAQPSAEPVYRK